ncbi:hypothetical protein [Campylobacter vicugnae]|uniref:hypothetical protein n=1 Tax=Campylobacter vicugnae TaxID=1660076 RepID=UPI00254E4A82|nr:hypothetical protein [Campylobacter ovis]MDL0104951.1 hypothetical protein [Campylobacter ovis]MDL0107117.1 hypothetical protein [Campylobacter ovis]
MMHIYKIILKIQTSLTLLASCIEELDSAVSLNDEEDILERAYDLIVTYRRIKNELELD